MRSSRLVSMLLLLQLRGRLTAPALAREFEVSVRTIYRDVDALSAAGVPIYADRGRTGGIALHAGYRAPVTTLSHGEARALPLAGLADVARDLGLGADAAQAQRKLLSGLPADSGAGAQRVAERFHLDPLPWYHPAESPDGLPALADAVWRGRRVRFDYDGWAGRAAREVAPLGLVLKGGRWYLVAAGDGGPRTYRVANIHGLQVLASGFARPAGFDLAHHWPAAVADFERRLLADTARLRLSPTGLRILRAEQPLAAARAEATQRPSTPPGWIEAEVPVETVAQAARQLLRLGAEAEVLAPAHLRRAVAREAARVQALYARSRAMGPAKSAANATKNRGVDRQPASRGAARAATVAPSKGE